MTPPSWIPPEDSVTRPDQIDARALEELGLLYGERVVRCWKAAYGFLVMTNLRCVHVWHKPLLFARTDWHTGPPFFFYDLAPPRVVAGRFVELERTDEVEASVARFLVHDPEAVAGEIEAARASGRVEWEARRARVLADLRELGPPAPRPGTTLLVREVVMVRCSYCGNLVELTRRLCPFCGAPQH